MSNNHNNINMDGNNSVFSWNIYILKPNFKVGCHITLYVIVFQNCPVQLKWCVGITLCV